MKVPTTIRKDTLPAIRARTGKPTTGPVTIEGRTYQAGELVFTGFVGESHTGAGEEMEIAGHYLYELTLAPAAEPEPEEPEYDSGLYDLDDDQADEQEGE